METIFQSIYFKTPVFSEHVLVWVTIAALTSNHKLLSRLQRIHISQTRGFARLNEFMFDKKDVMSKRFCGTLDTKHRASIVIYRYLQKILNLSSVAGIGPSMDTLRCESNAPNRWQPQSRHPEQEGLAHISQGSVDDRMETVRCEKQKREYSFDLKGGLCNLVRALLELQILKVRC